MSFNPSYPLSSEDMVYDYEEHMYVLNNEYVKAKMGVDLTLMVNDPYVVDKNMAVNQILRDISTQLYEFVYSYNKDNNYQEYMMAKSETARELIRKALVKQLGFIMRNGKINEFVGINMSFTQKNANLEAEAFRGEASIHPEAVQILKRALENGQTLLFSGKYFYPYDLKFRLDY